MYNRFRNDFQHARKRRSGLFEPNEQVLFYDDFLDNNCLNKWSDAGSHTESAGQIWGPTSTGDLYTYVKFPPLDSWKLTIGMYTHSTSNSDNFINIYDIGGLASVFYYGTSYSSANNFFCDWGTNIGFAPSSGANHTIEIYYTPGLQTLWIDGVKRSTKYLGIAYTREIGISMNARNNARNNGPIIFEKWGYPKT